MSRLLSTKNQVAFKTHQCDWCGEDILVGEKYNYISYIFDGEFGVGKKHMECLEACENTDEDLTDGYDFGMFKRGTDEYKW